MRIINLKKNSEALVLFVKFFFNLLFINEKHKEIKRNLFGVSKCSNQFNSLKRENLRRI